MFANGGTKRTYRDVCPLSGESDIAERSSSGRHGRYTPEHGVAQSQFSRGYCSRGFEADHVK